MRHEDRAEWLRMRTALWPHAVDDHAREMDEILASQGRSVVFVAAREGGGLAGFAEAGERSWAEGCDSSPVAYLEGWWVDEDVRRSGVGAQLVAAVEDWGRGRGFVEIASDAALDNEISQRAHLALGYDEAERVVCFRKSLAAASTGEGKA